MDRSSLYDTFARAPLAFARGEGAWVETTDGRRLLDFAGELYDEEVEIVFVEKLRDKQKVPSVDELKIQITRDIARAKTLFDS